MMGEDEVCIAFFDNNITNIQQRALVGTPWKEYANPEGRKYWHNPSSNETTWNLPDAVAENLKKIREQNQPPQRPPPSG
jgi:pre-mRNA-processing factor 40